MRVLENYELDLVAGGDRWGAELTSPSNLLRDMGEGAMYGGMIGLLVGGPLGELEGAADGAAAVLLVKGAGWIREALKMFLF